jgi:hypothetical protein
VEGALPLPLCHWMTPLSRQRVEVVQVIAREAKLSTQSSIHSAWIPATMSSKDDAVDASSQLVKSLPVSSAQPYSQKHCVRPRFS